MHSKPFFKKDVPRITSKNITLLQRCLHDYVDTMVIFKDEIKWWKPHKSFLWTSTNSSQSRILQETKKIIYCWNAFKRFEEKATTSWTFIWIETKIVIYFKLNLYYIHSYYFSSIIILLRSPCGVCNHLVFIRLN